MNRGGLCIFLILFFVVFVCTSGVASAINVDALYVGNTMVDVSWTEYAGDFSQYELLRNGAPIVTITNRSCTFYRDDSGLTKGNTYGYELRVYNSTPMRVDNGTTSAKAGDVHGTITVATNWTAASSPYALTGTVTVNEGATLTVGPGVTVTNGKIDVHGTIHVDGGSFTGEAIALVQANASSIKNSLFNGGGTKGPGLYLESCTDCYITGNTLLNYSASSGKGIYLWSSNSNTISGNNVSKNLYGFYLSSSNNNTLTSNIASNNRDGFYLSDSNINTLTSNTANSNDDYGIYLAYDSSFNTLTSNTANSNRRGIFLSRADDNTLTSNTASNNFYGVHLDGSSNNTLTNNTMAENNYNFFLTASSIPDYLQEIDASNVVDGKPIYYWVDRHGGAIPIDAGYVGLVNSDNITVRDIAVTKNSAGVLLVGTNDSRIENVNASSNYFCGIDLFYSHRNNLSNNTVAHNSYGIHAERSCYNALTNNTAWLNGDGIRLFYSSNSTLTKNTASVNQGNGIIVDYSSDYNTITNNNASQNDGDGIYVEEGDHNTITNNTASDNNWDGIYVDWGQYNTIKDNTLSRSWSENGIYLYYANNNNILNNTVNLNAKDGIYLYRADSNNISGNTISDSGKDGIGLKDADYNTITTNTVSCNNHTGISLEGSDEILIYNNFFNNTNNAYDMGTNTWNVTKRNGTNIVGGPYLGGNYWSDYTGTDTDDDLLGDTDLPWDSSNGLVYGGDYHPLLAEDISVSDIRAQVLVDGENATIQATVHSDAAFNVSNITVRLLVNKKPIQNKTVDIPQNASTNVTFDAWNVSWSVKDSKRQPMNITILVDPDHAFSDVNRSNNAVSRESPLDRGEKRSTADGRGFVAADSKSAVYGVPIAIWAAVEDPRLPWVYKCYYNPIATDIAVLNDIEADFKGAQYPNGIVNLNIDNFTLHAAGTFSAYWKGSPGIVIVEDTRESAVVGAPIASYLNWPMAPASLVKDHKLVAKNLIEDLNSSYVLVIADNKTTLNPILSDLKTLNLSDNQTIFVKGYAVEPLDNFAATDLFNEVLEAFGDTSSGIVVTNTRSTSSAAAAPLAAFYSAMIFDVRDVVTTPVNYAANTYVGLSPINNQVEDIVWKAGKRNVGAFIWRYRPPKPDKRSKTIYLVGDATAVPFGIERDPLDAAGIAEDCDPSVPGEQDNDRDWTATDYLYYSVTNTLPGGRMPLDDQENVNYMARALQFDELPVGERDIGDGWEDNLLGAGIYNIGGKRQWAKNRLWWLDFVVYTIRDVSGKEAGMEITQLYEKPSAHNGGWGKNWYRFDNRWGKVIKKAPLFWDTRVPFANPSGDGMRGDGVNNDNDCVGCENNDGRFPIERIVDTNNDGGYDPGEPILDDGLNPGIQSQVFVCASWLTIDEEVWDGFDNDGDGTIDEDCSYWHLLEAQEVYNEFLTPQDPDIDPGDWIDLTDANLINELGDNGIILYSGHSWTDEWQIRNLGGNTDPDGPGPIPPLTSDTRTTNEVTFSHTEVPAMAPSLVIASSCGSARLWEANCIAAAFLKEGALAYIGSTALAYDGTASDLVHQMFNHIEGGELHIGRAFKTAVDDLDKNGLWAKRHDEEGVYADKTRYEFNLIGLGSTAIDPAAGEERVTFGTPFYDAGTKTWSIHITCDIPEPTEIEDAAGNVSEIIFPPDLLRWLSDNGSYPALYLVPFDYELPIGGNFSNLSLVNATRYKIYNFSQYKVTDYGKWPVEPEPGNMSLNETIEEEPELYDGPLFPDVLFVNGSEHDSFANRDRVFGSVVALQVNGTINETTVYDELVLKLTYTAPIGLEETHVAEGTNLTVYATIVGTDGATHLVRPSLRLETEGGILYEEVTTAENVTINETPLVVPFQVRDVELPKYVGMVMVTEEGEFVAETSFTVGAGQPLVAITSFAPPSPVTDIVGNWRTFNATINQTANVSWYLNGTLIFTNESVTEASCRLHAAAVAGEHNVSVVASNANGTALQTWLWEVAATDTSREPIAAPALTPFGLTALVGLLSAVTVRALTRRKRR
jgi:parallel beta-helix repeat protein